MLRALFARDPESLTLGQSVLSMEVNLCLCWNFTGGCCNLWKINNSLTTFISYQLFSERAEIRTE